MGFRIKDSILSNPKQGFLQNVAIKEDACQKGSYCLF